MRHQRCREAEVHSGRTSSRCFHRAVPFVIGASRDEGDAVQGREESQKLGKRAGEEKAKNEYLLQVIDELEAVRNLTFRVKTAVPKRIWSRYSSERCAWGSVGENCHFNFNSNNLVPRAVPFIRTMDKRRAFRN